MRDEICVDNVCFSVEGLFGDTCFINGRRRYAVTAEIHLVTDDCCVLDVYINLITGTEYGGP